MHPRGVRCTPRGVGSCKQRGVRCTPRGVRCTPRGVRWAPRGVRWAPRGVRCTICPIIIFFLALSFIKIPEKLEIKMLSQIVSSKQFPVSFDFAAEDLDKIENLFCGKTISGIRLHYSILSILKKGIHTFFQNHPRAPGKHEFTGIPEKS